MEEGAPKNKVRWAELRHRAARRSNKILVGLVPRSRLGRTLTLGLITGVLAGLAARLLEWGLHSAIPYGIGRLSHDASAAEFFFLHPLIVILPALGGLVSGLAITFLCGPTRGHGTGQYIEAFHHNGGALGLRDAMIGAAAAVFLIACGGSVGKEAPTAILGAATGSAVAGRLGLPSKERRIFLVAGCAAGVGAVFQSPLGAALFAATVLYRRPEVEAEGILPSVIASVISYATFMAFGGYGHPLLPGTEGLVFNHPAELLAYAFLAVLCTAAGALFSYLLRGVTKSPLARLPAWLAPSIAGLAMGLIALVIPQVTDHRYVFIESLLQGEPIAGPWVSWTTALLVFVIVAKCLATALMAGTGSAGGIFGPLVFVGATVGGLCGVLLEGIVPEFVSEDLRAALIPVGMAGVMACTLRVPLAAVVMVTEITGSYGLIVPLMLVSGVSYLLGHRWGVYGEQVRNLTESPAHVGDALVRELEQWRVVDLMRRDWPYTVAPGTMLPKLTEKMPEGSWPRFAVVEGDHLVGVVSPNDMAHAVEVAGDSNLIVAADLMSSPPITAHPDESLYVAAGRMAAAGFDVLPVIDPSTEAFLGMLTRDSLQQMLRRRIAEQGAVLIEEHAGLAAIAERHRLEQMLLVLPESSRGVERRSVPQAVVGSSLREASFRRRYGCEVIAVETASGDILAPPDPGRHLEDDDILVVVKDRPSESSSSGSRSRTTQRG